MSRPPEDGFLSRWSRLKRAEPAAPPAPPAPAPGEAAPEPEGDALQDLIDSLPKLDDIAAGQDLSMFMQAWVPEPLRNAALRKLWAIDPAVRDFVSEALDYAYDYNNPASIPGFGLHVPTPDMAREALDLFDKAFARVGNSGQDTEIANENREYDESMKAAQPVRQSVSMAATADGAAQNSPPSDPAGLPDDADSGSNLAGIGREPPMMRGAAMQPSAAPDAQTDVVAAIVRRRHGGAMPQ